MTRTRRKNERPAEILSAAMDVFVEKGFTSAKRTDIAKRAGIVKGTLYLYFDTKEELFRAVVKEGLAVNLQGIEETGKIFKGELSELISTLLMQAASQTSARQLPAILRLVVAESRAFPDLATIWHDEVLARALNVLSSVIEEAQAQGNVRPGDSKLYAFSIAGPMVAANLFHEVFGSDSPYAPDLQALAMQHAKIVLNGLRSMDVPMTI